jgi:transcription initiation factor TFIIB
VYFYLIEKMVVDVRINKVFTERSKDDNTVRHTSACSLCKSENLITDTQSGEVICSKCGMVISDKIQDTRPESGMFPNTTEKSKERARTGMPTSLAFSDMGLSTVIGKINRDASGSKIEPSMLSTMHRLRTWDFRTQVSTSADRNFRLAFTELHMLKDKLGLPDSITEKTAYIYRKAQQRNLARGRSVSVILTAAIYIACREAGVPKTLKEIAVANNIKRKLVAKAYRVLISELGVKLPTCDPIKCVVKVANKANIDEKTKRQAIEIMDDVTKREISAGKDPMGLAATVLYISCVKTGENITQRDIAQAAGITDVTLRNRFKDLMDKLELN